MYFISLVKILLPVMDLNMVYKTQITSKNIWNSDFRKNREIWFSCYISRSSAPYAPFSPLRTVILYIFRLQKGSRSLRLRTKKLKAENEMDEELKAKKYWGGFICKGRGQWQGYPGFARSKESIRKPLQFNSFQTY